jgi:biotin carboxyl carrier protein
MPTYEIFIDGKPRRVELEKNGDNFTAKIDNRTHNVQLKTNERDLAGEIHIKMDGKPYRTELPKIEREKPFSMKVEEAAFKIELRNGARRQTLTSFEPFLSTPLRRITSSRKAAVEGAVTAPMTGKILSVKVRKGDQVKAKQVLCIIEAMKMENEITAPKDGAVQEVSVSDGASVTEGEVLLVID